jgi:hypothetical protein
VFFKSGLTRRIALRSSVGMDLIHQSLKRAPANLAQVSIFVRHNLLVAAGAVDMDASPSHVVVRFAQATVANESRFCSHTRD